MTTIIIKAQLTNFDHFLRWDDDAMSHYSLAVEYGTQFSQVAAIDPL